MMKRFINPMTFLGVLLLLGGMFILPTPQANAQSAIPFSGLFYANPDFTGNSQIVAYPSGLGINWGTGAPTDPATGLPLLGIPADGFSARFTSNTELAGGLYEFIVLADGGVRVSINGQVIINQIDSEGLNTYSSIINVATGAFLIIIDYVDYSGDALIQFTVQTTNGTPSVVQRTAQPANVGEVVQVRGLSLRSGPFLGGTLLGVARPGNAYPVLARNTQEGLFTWYLIQFDVDTQGWVSGRYFAITEFDPGTLPLQNADAFTTVYDPPGLVRGITRSNMNFRTFPTERAVRVEAVPQLPWGAHVEILARTRQGGQDYWYMVRYNVPNTDRSYVGWIIAPFVDIIAGSDPIETIPRL